MAMVERTPQYRTVLALDPLRTGDYLHVEVRPEDGMWVARNIHVGGSRILLKNITTNAVALHDAAVGETVKVLAQGSFRVTMTDSEAYIVP